jgi:4-amino-4-deoxy-L-arabinose transferase-like glycosyltransferase
MTPHAAEDVGKRMDGLEHAITERAPTEPPPAPRVRRRFVLLGVEGAAVAALLLVAVLARRPGYVLAQTFWLDESWVVDSVRAPLRQLRLVTSPTPIGFTLLLRAVPPLGGPQHYRLLPLAFGAATVVSGWLLGRRLDGFGPLRAALAGLAAALVPAALARHDLKQYQAEGFVAVTVLALVAWLEARWSRRRLAVLAVAAAASILLANTAPFVAAAAFAALALGRATRREWHRVAEAGVAMAAVATLHLFTYLQIASSADNPAMRRFWQRDFVSLDAGLGPAARFAGQRAGALLGSIGFGPWPLALALAVLGAVALVRAGRPGAGLLWPLLVLGLLAVGVAQRFPFLDPRTSLFAAILLAVYAGLGLGELAVLLLRRGWTAPLALAVVVGAGALLVPASVRAARTPIRSGNVRQQLEVVRAAWRSGDAVVVNAAGTFAFAYYWPDRPTFVPTRVATAVNFMVTYPDHPELVMVNDFHNQEATVPSAMALADAAGERIWIVYAHGSPRSAGMWVRAAARYGRVTHPGPNRFPVLIVPSGYRGS